MPDYYRATRVETYRPYSISEEHPVSSLSLSPSKDSHAYSSTVLHRINIVIQEKA